MTLWFCASTLAEDTPPAMTVTLEAAVVSAYASRGQVVCDDPVIQAACGISKGCFSFQSWINWDLTKHGASGSREITEVDLTFAYSRQFGPVASQAGLTEYLFPNQTAVDETGCGRASDGTREAFISLSLPDAAIVPTLKVFLDIDEVSGWYATFTLAYEHPLPFDPLTLRLEGGAGYANADYNDSYFYADRSTWNEGTAAMTLLYKASEGGVLSAAVQYMCLLNDELRGNASEAYAAERSLFGTVKCSWTF
jgi:hypothetical protein